MDPVTRDGKIAFGSLSEPGQSSSKLDESQQSIQYELLDFTATELKEPSGTIIREGIQVTYVRVKNKVKDIAIEIKPEWY